MCWLLSQNYKKKPTILHSYKKKHNTCGMFLLWDCKEVSINILFWKDCLGWKLYPIINRWRVEIRMSWVEKTPPKIAGGHLLGTQEYFGRYSFELAQLTHFLIFQEGQLIIPRDCMFFMSTFLDVTRISMSTVSFLTQQDSGIFCLQNTFRWHIYDLNGLKSNLELTYILTIGCFSVCR